MTEIIDLGGNTVITENIRVGSTAPGQAGTDISGTELTVLDGVTAGTVTASRAVVVDSNKDITTFRNVTGVNYDAGASGTAGTVDIFPTTASKGKIQIAAADSAGNTTTTITNASQAGAWTYTIPDAGASASFVLSTGTSTGVAVTSTEFGVLASATNANAGTSKAMITGTSGALTVAGALTVSSTSTFTGAPTFNANPVIGVGKTIDLDSSTATLSSNAATITKYACVVTSESLTTAAAASQAFVLTLTGVAAGDLAFVTKAGGTNTRKNYQLEAVTTSNTITVTLYNTEPTNAINGTVIFNLWVLKS